MARPWRGGARRNKQANRRSARCAAAHSSNQLTAAHTVNGDLLRMCRLWRSGTEATPSVQLKSRWKETLRS
jgi:hypothetical protein